MPPRHPWEIPVSSDVLVSSALAFGRPTALGGRPPRRNGSPDDVVLERHRLLHDAVLERAAPAPQIRARLEDLLSAEPQASWTRWQTAVMAVDADDDASVIGLAQDVWDALGSNAYGLEFLDRRRTYRGFFEGRTWLDLALVPLVLLTVLAIDGAARAQAWWWLVAVVALAWPFTIWQLFRRSYRRREAIAQRELPHL